MDICQNGNMKNIDSQNCVAEKDEIDFSKFTDRPRPLNIERQRSCDERSLGESIGLISPRHLSRNADSFARHFDHLDYAFSPGRRSGFSTPRSHTSFEPQPHPIVAEAWEALRSSLVHFRGQPVGTIAALDPTEENLNYDQVNSLCLY